LENIIESVFNIVKNKEVIMNCKYCNPIENKSIIKIDGDEIGVYIIKFNGEWSMVCNCDDVYERHIHFCPMCGRELKAEEV
jgi:hypothetical protein